MNARRFVSDITSPTARVFPVEEICAATREAGALAIVDGAHVPGQLPLGIEAARRRRLCRECHKWLCAPKGAGFLWARPEHQEWIDRSWSAGVTARSRFRRAARLGGDRGPAAYLTVPKSIQVHATFDPERQRELADQVERRLAEPPCRVPGEPAPYMRAFECTGGRPRRALAAAGRGIPVEAPVYEWAGRRVLRVSIGPYNDEEDVERLLGALDRCL